jgi:hypothetical protein
LGSLQLRLQVSSRLPLLLQRCLQVRLLLLQLLCVLCVLCRGQLLLRLQLLCTCHCCIHPQLNALVHLRVDSYQ